MDAHDTLEANVANMNKILAWINDMKGPTGARGFEKAISIGTTATKMGL